MFLGPGKCNKYSEKKTSNCLHFIVSDACVLLQTVWICDQCVHFLLLFLYVCVSVHNRVV